jgi:hypothetical protein
VPVLLSSSGGGTGVEPSSAPAPTSPLLGRQSAALLGETQPIVTQIDRRPFRRRLAHLPRKNPFVQQAQPKKNSASESLQVGGAAGGGDAGSVNPETFTGGVPPSVPGTGDAGPGSDTGGGVQQRKFVYTAVVEFGEIGDTTKKTLDPTDSLPNDKDAIVIYLGSDGKSALFLASSGVTARGDGACEPSRSNCAILRMTKGDVEFFEVPGVGDSVTTYQLELKAIGEKTLSEVPANVGSLRGRAGVNKRDDFDLRHEQRFFESFHELTR